MRRGTSRGDDVSANGRFLARPGALTPLGRGPGGLRGIGLESGRDGVIYVPPSVAQPAPLVLALHGAGGNGREHVAYLRPLADEHGVILLSPDSRLGSWDVLYGGYGPDVRFIDRALEQVFGQYEIDPLHVAVEGFSDGASYALSIGLTNGDLFSHVIAFSPGFMAPAAQEGSPKIFVSHGTRDTVLPIDRCSRRIVPQLEAAGYDVRYQEFDGPHTVPPDIAKQAMEWFCATR